MGFHLYNKPVEGSNTPWNVETAKKQKKKKKNLFTTEEVSFPPTLITNYGF